MEHLNLFLVVHGVVCSFSRYFSLNLSVFSLGPSFAEYSGRAPTGGRGVRRGRPSDLFISFFSGYDPKQPKT